MDLGYSSIASSRRQSIGEEPDYKKVMLMIVMPSAMKMVMMMTAMKNLLTYRLNVHSKPLCTSVRPSSEFLQKHCRKLAFIHPLSTLLYYISLLSGL